MHLRNFLLVMSLLTFGSNIPPATALIEDVLDIFHVVKEVTKGILQAWDFVQETTANQEADLPFLREKQKKVLRSIKDLSRRIDQTEGKFVHEFEWAVDSINSFVKQSIGVEIQMNKINEISNRIGSRFKHMQRYEKNQDKFEQITLMKFAEWSVSPNTDAINYMLEDLHNIFIGSKEKKREKTKGVLEIVSETLSENYPGVVI